MLDRPSLTAAGRAARLVDGRRLREMTLAARHDVRQYDPPADPDDELVAETVEPYDSVADAEARLERLEQRLLDRGDRRAVFLTIYSRMTSRIRTRLDGGAFANTEWMRAYTTTFANYYRRAFLAFERGDLGAVPDPWRIAFGTAFRGDALVMQDAFLGINAHVNYDLALTLRDVGIDARRATKRADHFAVDDMLTRLVDVQQRLLAEVYAPGVADIDATFGRLDERLSLLGITEGREQAWRVAVVLEDAAWPPIRSAARWVLRATATGGAVVIRNAGLHPHLLDRLRRLEREGITDEEILASLVSSLDEV
ncbi:DUF5995 family protein [Haloarculaceae archaeon H-GB11]|nr:DUF5995 family protein [Haloarculaceae archaeon H-GB11]